MKLITAFGLCGLAGLSQAALFNVTLTATATLPPAITNKYGNAIFSGTAGHLAGSTGNAAATADSSATTIPSGGSHSSSLSGNADCDPFVLSNAVASTSTSQKFNMGNLTGSIGAPETLNLSIAWTCVYSLEISAGDGETATGTISVVLAGTTLLTIDASVADNHSIFSSGTLSGFAPVSLPPNSVTPEYLTTSVSGSASAPLCAVPEPASMVALGVGVMAVLRRRR